MSTNYTGTYLYLTAQLSNDSGWLKAFDVDARGGRGEVTLTRDKAQAIRFVDARAALEAWRTQSTVMPLRPDLRPNRPLTAYHAEILRGDAEPLLPQLPTT
jgi:hypothetical protein